MPWPEKNWSELTFARGIAIAALKIWSPMHRLESGPRNPSRMGVLR